MSDNTPTYHDVYVTTETIERTSIFDLPYGYEVTCNRVGGWTLWKNSSDEEGMRVAGERVAGEYDENGLRVDVAGHVICDSLSEREQADDD